MSINVSNIVADTLRAQRRDGYITQVQPIVATVQQGIDNGDSPRLVVLSALNQHGLSSYAPYAEPVINALQAAVEGQSSTSDVATDSVEFDKDAAAERLLEFATERGLPARDARSLLTEAGLITPAFSRENAANVLLAAASQHGVTAEVEAVLVEVGLVDAVEEEEHGTEEVTVSGGTEGVEALLRSLSERVEALVAAAARHGVRV